MYINQIELLNFIQSIIPKLENIKSIDDKYYFYSSEVETDHNYNILFNQLDHVKCIIRNYTNWYNITNSKSFCTNFLKFIIKKANNCEYQTQYFKFSHITCTRYLFNLGICNH